MCRHIKFPPLLLLLFLINHWRGSSKSAREFSKLKMTNTEESSSSKSLSYGNDIQQPVTFQQRCWMVVTDAPRGYKDERSVKVE